MINTIEAKTMNHDVKDIITSSKARLRYIRSDSASDYHWLFLPGGPGLGSESLSGLVDILHLPGTLWYADLPGDGSNHTEDDEKSFSQWTAGLLELVSHFDKVVLVAHSSGGFFALATQGLEKCLKGLVLISSAPDASWQNAFSEYVKSHPITEAERLQVLYQENPSNELLKQLTIACAPYFSREKSIKPMEIILEKLPFNYKSHLWAKTHFDDTYHAQWVPQNIPTLIFSGDSDIITPVYLFKSNEDFQRKNINIHTIKNASHFPWIDNPENVKDLFQEFYLRLIKQ